MQPERSTLPEGGMYFNQFEAIAALRARLPVGVSILVTEHPSTFRRLADPNYRNREFYKRIASLKNTFFVDFSESSYDLIDASSGVATITGKLPMKPEVDKKILSIFCEGKYIGPIDQLGINKISVGNLEPWSFSGNQHDQENMLVG